MKQQSKTGWQRNLVTSGPSIFLGLTLLASGTGKALIFGELPGELEFIDVLLGPFYTPTTVYLIFYCLPWAEIALGALLLLGVFPRIAAALCLPLTIGFMASNSYALSRGIEQFSTCAHCFGKWEILFGAMSPLQALCFDIVLFSLALIILLFHPTGVLHSRPWFIKSRKEEPK
ncbi:MAG: hypothetical protein COY46_02835 [Chloroflexi bacterium CG_4_10_14_0_8_um_filter_46_9]|nr:MAG: hypothetical protein AUK39_01840 [Dehalococcoidia bacterium CG2_30_46_19]PIW39878.1 MAG: hypothetical protein COW22_04845 [Chloroflexi bacterium CG15_BIG_FIL_POST_REV_8_21_14_020_46_15]PIZ26849.1 MAG: hypothetical protein COY46_02835 [Chloroflexi bacterium CG_4_10_14_0_8_um_filter_46_9]